MLMCVYSIDIEAQNLQAPAVYVSKYDSAATYSTKSCQLSVNTTDNFNKVLYTGGADVTYSSVQDFVTALTNGDFVLGMTPSEQLVQVRNYLCQVNDMYGHKGGAAGHCNARLLA